MRTVKVISVRGLFDKLFAVLFAVLPLVQPLKNSLQMSWSMFILICATPYIAIKLITSSISIKNVWPVFLFMIYRIINHGTTAEELLTSLFICFLSIAVINRQISVGIMLKTEIFISTLASFGLIIQTVCHYVLKFHVQMMFPELLRTSQMVQNYAGLMSTGMSYGLYRPSAFLLEPAQVTLYFLPGLLYLVFKKPKTQWEMMCVIIMSIGIVLSTSGMGMALLSGIWFTYFLRRSYKKGKIHVKWLLVLIIMAVAFLIAVITVPVMRNAAIRIFSATGGSQVSAIQGRFGSGSLYVSQLLPNERIWGINKSAEDFALYISGYHEIVLSDGYIGFALYALIYIYYAVKMKNSFSLLAVLIICLTFFSNIYLIHYNVFFIIFMLYGMYEKQCIKKMKRAYQNE